MCKGKFLLLAVVFLTVLGFATSAVAKDVVYFTMAGASSQGRWYAEVSFLAKLITEKMPNVRATGVVSPGVSRGNIKRMASGEIPAARVFGDDIWALNQKLPPFDKKDYNIKAWFKCVRQPIRVIAKPSIKTMQDLKGKKVGLGVRGSGDDTFALRLLNFYGIKEKDIKAQFVGRKVAQNSFANHQIDAIIESYTRNNQRHLGPVFAARALGKASHFIAPTMEEAKAFCKKWPCYAVDTYGEPVFKQPDLIGIYMTTIMAVRGDIDEDLVYNITKLFFENWDEVIEALPWWKPSADKKLGVCLENAMSIPAATFHPGALRYYKEMGVAK